MTSILFFVACGVYLSLLVVDVGGAGVVVVVVVVVVVLLCFG